MRHVLVILFLGISFFLSKNSDAQSRKFDSTLRVGRVGFRAFCNNKNVDRNELSIKPIGFKGTARDISFYIKGYVARAALDDLNNDGFPDLLLYIYSGAHGEFGTVYAFASNKNESVIPFALPDVMLDGKLSEGYKGHDSFSLMEGSLMQKFPVYKPGDEADKPTGGSRVVQYQMVGNENEGFKFRVERSYDLK